MGTTERAKAQWAEEAVKHYKSVALAIAGRSPDEEITIEEANLIMEGPAGKAVMDHMKQLIATIEQNRTTLYRCSNCNAEFPTVEETLLHKMNCQKGGGK